MFTPYAISVYLITLNEELHLKRLLPQLQQFAEIVVVDSGSQDGTEEVARSFPNVRFSSHPWQGFGKQKQHALELCQQNWVLNLDADEELTDELIDDMLECMQRNEVEGLTCERRLLRFGRRPRGSSDETLLRFFKRGYGVYTEVSVHESIKLTGKLAYSKALLLHHDNLSYSERIQKVNLYSELGARDKFVRGKRATVAHLLLAGPIAFLRCYFLKGGILDGSDGFITSMNHGFYTFLKYAKLRQIQKLSCDPLALKQLQKNADKALGK